MSKSVGGFIQLIIPKGQMTWEEYKKKYGIDLDEYFVISDNVGVEFIPYFNKPILISGANDGTSSTPGCGFLSEFDSDSVNTPKTLSLIYGNFDTAGVGVALTSDRHIYRLDI